MRLAAILMTHRVIFELQELEEKLKEGKDKVEKLVREYPLTSVAIAFGFGYMLAKVDYQSFKRYEYVTRTSLGEMTAEIYMEQALKLVKESPAATAK